MKLDKHSKQAIFLYVSTLLGTLLGVLSSIVNTRFLSPEDYGDVRYVQNIINFFSIILLLGYFQSGSRLLALSNSEKRSERIRGALVVILITTCLILLLFIGVFSLFHLNNLKLAHLFVVSMAVCFYPLFNNYINTTAQGDNHIIRISINRLLPMLIYVPLGYTIYSFSGATPTKMILLQWGIYTFVGLLIIVSTKPNFTSLRPIFHQLNIENRNYGIQLYYGSLVMVATNYIAGVTLGVFNEDNVNVGFYTLALTVTSPLALLPSIIGTTYFKQFAIQNQIPGKVLKITVFMSILSFLFFVATIHYVVKLLYSEPYAMVGVYASWLALGYCLHGLGDMLNRYLGSHGQGKSIRNASVFCGIFKIFGFVFFVYFWNITGAILTCIISSTAYFVSITLYYLKFVRSNEV